MRVAILAGGKGSRLDPSGHGAPKALTEIGGRPILWHLLRYFACFGHDEFYIALGFKAEQIRQAFLEGTPPAARPDQGHLSLRYSFNCLSQSGCRLNLIETGQDTMTGGRIKRLGPSLGQETFILTYCDGLWNVDLKDLVAFHRVHGKLATLTAVHPPSHFGHMDLDGPRVRCFMEKPEDAKRWINAAIWVLEPEALDYVAGDETVWEREPLERLAEDGQLMAYRHEGFWQCMDSRMQAIYLNELWDRGDAPWKLWE